MVPVSPCAQGERIFTVSELTRGVRLCLERRFGFVAVAGEVSDLRRPASGHIYFTLKDGQARLRAVLFRMRQRWQAVLPRQGQQVVCRGRLSVYEPRGDYQLIIDSVEEQGAGDLRAELERLKRRLAAEGLFAAHIKRPLPRFPEHLVLITSASGAAVHDFLRVARSRLPVRISILPCPVQGEGAAALLCAGIRRINEDLPEAEVLVLCRGGGSGEDLQAFNDESLARTIRSSRIPVVSAVGHEIDVTIADLAADLRAPTPSAAAEMILPDAKALEQRLQDNAQAMIWCIERRLRWFTQRLETAQRVLAGMQRGVEHAMLRLDYASTRLEQGIRQYLQERSHRVDQAGALLLLHGPERRVAALRTRLLGLAPRLENAGQALVEKRRQSLRRRADLLQAVSPLAVLARGYALARGPDGAILRRSTQVQPGERLRLILHQGELDCRVEAVQEPEIQDLQLTSKGSAR